MAEGIGQGPVPPDQPERDYWLLSEATYRYRDEANMVYCFPDGTRHIVPDHLAVACKDDLRNIHVRKMGVPVATGTLKNSWKPYTTATGTTGGYGDDFRSAFAQRVKTLEVKAARIAGPPPVDVEAAAKSLTSVMAKMEAARTPRQWLDFRVSEIAEQGRL